MAELSQNAEQEIAELEKMLAEKRAALELQKEAGEVEEIPHPKEILREVIREKIASTPGPAVPAPVVPPPPLSKPVPPGLPADTPSYDLDELKPKVDQLVEHAFQKSLDEAISFAKAADNEALLDAFHDIIVDELYDHLVEQKKLEAVGD